jgi:hypothetical protein
LQAIAVPHQVGHGCRWRHVLFRVCFRSCFEVFRLYVANGVVAIYVCCKYMFQVFQLFHTYVSRVSSVCFICFICMFHMFHLDVEKDLMLHMLQWLHTYVSSDVAMATHLCFK